MINLINKKGNYNNWLLPDKLYHGTTDIYLESILKEGLKINHKEKNSVASMPLIYLTTSIEMAKSFGNSVAYRKKGNPIILEINSDLLEADLIGFDWNISLELSSQCITYNKEKIEVQKIITDLNNIKEAKMIFNEPQDLTTPVMWNLNEERAIKHLELIGYVKKEMIKKNKI